MPISEGGARALRQDLWRRTTKPTEHVTFWAYFVGSVIFLGGLGIWVELVNLAREPSPANLFPLRTAVATFFSALYGSACFQVVLGRYLKALRAIAYVGTLVYLVIGFWLLFDRSLSPTLSLSVGGIATLVSLWFWWITNADNPDFFDEPLNQAAIGGNPDRPLEGDLGDFEA